MERKTHSYSLAGQKVGKLLVGEEVANLESMMQFFLPRSLASSKKEAPLSPRDRWCHRHQLPSLTQLAEPEVQSLFACYPRKLCSHEKASLNYDCDHRNTG